MDDAIKQQVATSKGVIVLSRIQARSTDVISSPAIESAGGIFVVAGFLPDTWAEYV